jgi:peptidoglycan/LPS O-acetylase OafA/YrhL
MSIQLQTPALSEENVIELSGASSATSGRRIEALDGVRGLMTILVVVSHFFAELPGGIHLFAFGWIAVDMFFVLSGFLVGRLILDKGHAGNFLTVFFIRRALRTFPIYFVCLGAIVLVLKSTSVLLGNAPPLPLWSYFVFLQNLMMSLYGSTGVHLLAPTWTLAVEEQFYLIIPFVFLALGRRYLLWGLGAAILVAICLRAAFAVRGFPATTLLSELPGRADCLALGVAAAVLMAQYSDQLLRYRDLLTRLSVTLLFALLPILVLDPDRVLFAAVGHTFVSVACACLLLALVMGAPEAQRMKSPCLKFFGDNSYAIYLTHLPILWAMHWLVLSAVPALQSRQQLAVTLCTIPVCIFVSWMLTRTIEAPITSLGRQFHWDFTKCEAAPVVYIDAGPTRQPRLFAAEHLLIASGLALFLLGCVATIG